MRLVGFMICWLLASLTSGFAAPLQILPKAAKILVGQKFEFQALDGERPLPCHWQLLGSPEEVQGEFAGNVLQVTGMVGQIVVLRVLATAQDDPRRLAEAWVAVVDPEFQKLMNMTQGEDWLLPYVQDAALPFAGDPAAAAAQWGGRPNDLNQDPWNPQRARPLRLFGYGWPGLVEWAQAKGAVAQRLSYLTRTGVQHLDVTGRHNHPLVLREPTSLFRIESLLAFGDFRSDSPPEWFTPKDWLRSWLRGLQPGAGWMAKVEEGKALVTGILPLAGQPQPAQASAHGAARLHHADGLGNHAQFGEPRGLVRDNSFQNRGAAPDYVPGYLVTDAQTHVLRRVTDEGRVSTVYGWPGQAGHQDGVGQGARFNTPMGLAAGRRDPATGRLEFFVADSGNHVIRQITATGEVRTFAGEVGSPGHADSGAAPATFDRPVAIAVRAKPFRVFVADQGSGLIRSIDAAGQVTTLAGRAGIHQAVDGKPGEASFRALKGLTLSPSGDLLVLDGCALRTVAMDGTVTTRIGDPDRPGFLGQWRGPANRLAGVACFQDPCAVILIPGQGMLVVDRGNHSLVHLLPVEPDNLELCAIAGAPGDARLRYGLLRFGIPAEPETGPIRRSFYGAFDAPAALVQSNDIVPTFVLASGSCLVRIVLPPRLHHLPQGPSEPPQALEDLAGKPSDRPWLAIQEDRVTVARDVQIKVWAPTGGIDRGCPFHPGRPIRYSVDLLSAGEGPGHQVRGSGTGDKVFQVTGRFPRPGPGKILLRYVSDEGWSKSLEVAVEVSADPAPHPHPHRQLEHHSEAKPERKE